MAELRDVAARLIAYYGVRNTELENLHVHNISDAEMRVLMLSVEEHIGRYLQCLIECGLLTLNAGTYSAADLHDYHQILLGGPSYDRKDWQS